MDEKITVKPDTIYLPDLLDEVKRGQYKIPKFQRDFVWTPNQMVELFDSLLKGYPMGSLLFWKTDDEFRYKENIGIFTLSNNTKNFSYVLDGFQRIATLFNSLMSPKDFDESCINIEKEKDFLIYFDIRDNSFIHAKARKSKSIFLVPLYEIYDDKLLFYFLRKLDNEHIAQADKESYAENTRNLNYILHKYRVPFVEIRGGDIKNATTIFSRINSKGTEISTDFMISALAYNKDTGFTFSDELSDFLDELNDYNFNEIDRNTILNCIVACATDNFFYDVKIEKQIETKNFDLEAETKKAFVCIKNAIEFLYQIGVLSNKFLPYGIQLIFITDFFRINPEPTKVQLEKLETWFWVTSYTAYFTNYSNMAQQRSAYLAFKEFSQGKHEDGIYKIDNDLFEIPSFPNKLSFQGVRSKVLQLFMLRQIKDSSIEFNESIKEQFVFALTKEQTRTPANMILRFGSEFEMSGKEYKKIDYFIQNSDIEKLESYFINEEIRQLFLAGKKDEFVTTRQKLIQEKEKLFVESFGISYSELQE